MCRPRTGKSPVVHDTTHAPPLQWLAPVPGGPLASHWPPASHASGVVPPTPLLRRGADALARARGRVARLIRGLAGGAVLPLSGRAARLRRVAAALLLSRRADSSADPVAGSVSDSRPRTGCLLSIDLSGRTPATCPAHRELSGRASAGALARGLVARPADARALRRVLPLPVRAALLRRIPVAAQGSGRRAGPARAGIVHARHEVARGGHDGAHEQPGERGPPEETRGDPYRPTRQARRSVAGSLGSGVSPPPGEGSEYAIISLECAGRSAAVTRAARLALTPAQSVRKVGRGWHSEARLAWTGGRERRPRDKKEETQIKRRACSACRGGSRGS